MDDLEMFRDLYPKVVCDALEDIDRSGINDLVDLLEALNLYLLIENQTEDECKYVFEKAKEKFDEWSSLQGKLN